MNAACCLGTVFHCHIMLTLLYLVIFSLGFFLPVWGRMHSWLCGQQLCKLSLKALLEAREHGEPAGEEDGLGHLPPHVQAALSDRLLYKHVHTSLVETPDLGLEDSLGDLKPLHAKTDLL